MPLIPSLLRSISLPVFLSILFLSPTLQSFSQDRCGTVEYNQKLRKEKKIIEQDADFEKWIKQKKLNRKNHPASGRTQTATYQVPVVFHIIHNNEAVGVGTNISDAQIYSQLDVLNKDFRRLNADASNTPSEFLDVAGSMDIEFIMAKQTPDGQATNGIVRIKGTQSAWTVGEYDILKSQSYWNADNYLNVWVSNVTDYLGYTQFPVSDLPGLEGSPDVANTDGIIVAYNVFGSEDDGPFNLDNRYAKGRTLTHEMGHFFGLRHIWGDVDGCSGDDYVEDTPTQSASTKSCPSTALSSCVANVHKMYQNYLDYTHDACMNMFTKDQVERMRIVLENCVRRYSLLESPGLQDPDPVADDLEITTIISPGVTTCNTVEPAIEIKNKGTNAILSAQIQLRINSTAVETLNLSIDLDPLETTIITFSPQALNSGTSTFTFDILHVNDTDDVNSFNNIVSLNSINFEPVATAFSIPLREKFENSFTEHWKLINPSGGKDWKTVTTNYNTSVGFESFSNSVIEDEAWLISPPLDLSHTDKASMFFDLSYAFNANRLTHENLRVFGSIDCEDAFNILLYEQSGESLAVINSSGNWIPEETEDWSRQFVNLTSLTGNEKVRLAFVITNGHGNNLYIDNIEFFNSDEPVQPTDPKPFFIYYNTLTTSDFYVKFNLEDKQPVNINIMDTMGRIVYKASLTDILNETYFVKLEAMAAGMYIMQLQSRQQVYATQVFIGNK